MKYFSIIVLILLSVNIFAQNIVLNYYSTGAGRNITATYSKLINNSEVGFGIGYNIGSIKQPDDQGNIYYKRLYPTKPIHYLNLNSFYNFYFLKKMSCIKPFLFYDLQIKYSTTRSSMYIIHDYDSTLNGNIPEENLLYRNFIEYFGPFLWVENSLGLGFKVNITENIYLKQNLGLGMHLIFGEDSRLLGQNPVWEFYGFTNIGVGIKIKSPQ